MNRLSATFLSVVFLSAMLLPSIAGADADKEEYVLTYRYGFLLVDSVVARPVSDWKSTNAVVIESLPLGRHLQLLKLRAGRYQWTEINVPHYDLPHRVDLSDDWRWSFEIEAGKINYAGTLFVGERRGSDSADVRMINRSSEVLDRLRQEFPDVAASYDLIYSGPTRDDYFTLIQGETPNEAH